MLTVLQAARRTHRHPETIRRWIWAGRLHSRKVGNRHLIGEAELERLQRGESPDAESFAEGLEAIYRLHDEVGYSPPGVPSGAELIEAERRSH